MLFSAGSSRSTFKGLNCTAERDERRRFSIEAETGSSGMFVDACDCCRLLGVVIADFGVATVDLALSILDGVLRTNGEGSTFSMSLCLTISGVPGSRLG